MWIYLFHLDWNDPTAWSISFCTRLNLVIFVASLDSTRAWWISSNAVLSCCLFMSISKQRASQPTCAHPWLPTLEDFQDRVVDMGCIEKGYYSIIIIIICCSEIMRVLSNYSCACEYVKRVLSEWRIGISKSWRAGRWHDWNACRILQDEKGDNRYSHVSQRYSLSFWFGLRRSVRLFS